MSYNLTEEQTQNLNEILGHLQVWLKFHRQLRDDATSQLNVEYHENQVENFEEWIRVVESIVSNP